MPIDMGTGLAILGGAAGSAQVIQRILGPTADYIGEGIKGWTEMRVQNVRRIFDSAERKLGNKIDEQGSVPPRVLNGILTEGSYCDDPLTVEYFGGVLASSRSSASRDDRGSTLVTLISQLSTYQIRMHYICYSVMKELCKGTSVSPGLQEGRERLATFIPMDGFHEAFEFDEQENWKIAPIVTHAIWGLFSKNLIDESFAYGEPEEMGRLSTTMPSPGMLFQPSNLGIELYLWAHGIADTEVAESIDAMVRIELLGEIPINLVGAQMMIL